MEANTEIINKEISTALFPCPCCGNLTLSKINAYEICTICLWEDDQIQSSDPDYSGGANNCSLTQARSEFLKNKKIKIKHMNTYED